MGLFVNIHSKGKYPANALSNFYPHSFRLDGIPIKSMESFLQSLKFADLAQQVQVCHMDARDAKALGQQQPWQKDGRLYWQGVSFSRYGKEYKGLLDRAYDALGRNPRFIKALQDSGRRPLLHTVGRIFKHRTCLTAGEFCRQLRRQRKHVRKLSAMPACPELVEYDEYDDYDD